MFSLNLEKPIHGKTWVQGLLLFVLRHCLFNLISGMEWNPNCLQRSVQGVLSILLSLKKNPTIRYQNFSTLARRLAENIRVNYETYNSENLILV